MVVELASHQLKAIEELHNGSILNGDVGTGKSRTAIAYYYLKVCEGVFNSAHTTYRPMKRPMDLYIFTTAKKRNTQEWGLEAIPFGLSTHDRNSEGVKIVVDSWNNITRYDDLSGAMVIFDEQRLVGSGAWVKSFYKIAANNQWIVLSATPGDTWMDYCPIFVANGFYKNKSDFAAQHVVYKRYVKFPQIDRYVNTKKLERLRHRILVYMDYERQTSRHKENVLVDHDAEKLALVIKKRWHVYEDRPLKNAAELFLVMRKVVNEDTSRLGAIMKIYEKHPRLIIFYNFNYELEALRTLAGLLSVEVREWNGKKHEALPVGDSWIYLVQYTAGAEGWNCITTDAMVFYSLTYSYKTFEQAQGRIDRLNTPYRDLHYYILRSSSKVDGAIWRAIQMKQMFNAKRYTEKVWEGSNAKGSSSGDGRSLQHSG